jgi:hypothetical protein
MKMTNLHRTKVNGVTFEGRQAILSELVGNEPCRLRPEPENKYDTNAIAVDIVLRDEICHVGYIPKEVAKLINDFYDLETMQAEIDEITGGFEIDRGSHVEQAYYGLIIRFELPDLEGTNDYAF